MTNHRMRKLNFPERFTHQHPPVRNVTEIVEGPHTLSQRAADRVAAVVGSWRFIIIQSFLLVGWGSLNVTAYIQHWDPYPFILMNLFLSLQAAYTAPIIMMSQNRQACYDRIGARNDYEINQKAEEEIRAILEHLSKQDEALAEIHELLAGLRPSTNSAVSVQD